MWRKCVALHKQGGPSFQLGCVCQSVRGEVCAQSQAHLEAVLKCRCCSLGRVQLCPSSKVGCSSFIFMIAKGTMGARFHPDPSAQKMDPEDDILDFHFPFKCHLDLFFPLPRFFTLAVFNYREYQKILPQLENRFALKWHLPILLIYTLFLHRSVGRFRHLYLT